MNLDMLEALLFTQADPVSLEQLARWLDCGLNEAQDRVNQLSEMLRQRGSGVVVQWTAGGVRLTSNPLLQPELSERIQYSGPEPLSHASWEVLAIVAYRQPVTRLEIEAIRQTGSERALETLLNRELIEEVGRKESPGRPILYGTTPGFLQQFGLFDLEDLPKLSQMPEQPA